MAQTPYANMVPLQTFFLFYVGCLKPPDSGVDDHPCQPQVSRSFDHGACAVGKCQAVRSILFGTPSATALRHVSSKQLLAMDQAPEKGWSDPLRLGGSRPLASLSRASHLGLPLPCRRFKPRDSQGLVHHTNHDRGILRQFGAPKRSPVRGSPRRVRVGPCDLARSAWGVV